MLKVAVLVSGGGTNLQAILDAIDEGRITNARVDVVISNNPGAYALERAKGHGIEALCISPKDYESREAFNEAFLAKLDSYQVADPFSRGREYARSIASRCQNANITFLFHNFLRLVSVTKELQIPLHAKRKGILFLKIKAFHNV